MKHVERCIAHFVQQAPVCLAYVSSFCSHPAKITSVSSVIPDDRMRLQLTNHAERLSPSVVCLSIDTSAFICASIPSITSVGTIEPNLEDVAILCQQLTKLITEISNILRTPILWVVTIPRREIDSKFQPLFLTSISQFTHHITLSLFPRCVFHRILRIC